MNGLTGEKMQKIFRALVPESLYNDARNLVEYCCFRFLSRDNSDLHPSLKVCESNSKLILHILPIILYPSIGSDRLVCHDHAVANAYLYFSEFVLVSYKHKLITNPYINC